jgi:hypothetical protein
VRGGIRITHSLTDTTAHEPLAGWSSRISPPKPAGTDTFVVASNALKPHLGPGKDGVRLADSHGCSTTNVDSGRIRSVTNGGTSGGCNCDRLAKPIPGRRKGAGSDLCRTNAQYEAIRTPGTRTPEEKCKAASGRRQVIFSANCGVFVEMIEKGAINLPTTSAAVHSWRPSRTIISLKSNFSIPADSQDKPVPGWAWAAAVTVQGESQGKRVR